MNRDELNTILKEHEKWLAGDGGARADLRSANLQSAYLQSADLRGASPTYRRWENSCQKEVKAEMVDKRKKM